MCCLAERLSSHWDKSFGEVFGWIKTQLSFAVIRATDLCLGDHVQVGDGVQGLLMELDSLLFCLFILNFLL